MKVAVKRNINGPADTIWAYLADYSNIHKFHPLLKDSHFVDGAKTCDLGSTRQCNMKDGNYLKERIVDWVEGSHYTVDIYDTSMPIKNAKATLGVKAIGPNQTEAYMHMELEPKYKILQPVMYLMFRFFAAPTLLKGLEKLHKQEQVYPVV